MRGRAYWATLVLLVSAAGASTPSATSTSTSTYWAHQFVDSVGVNTHLRHTRSFYSDHFDVLKERLRAARIVHIRDGAMDHNGSFLAADGAERFRALGEQGIRTTFIFRPLVTRQFVQEFPARVSPAFAAYELPNELNLSRDAPWAEVLRMWMPAFARHVRGGAQSSRYPILGPSIADLGGDPHLLLGNQSGELDFGNLHKYYRAFHPATSGYGKRGSPPCEAWAYGSLPYALCQVRRISGDKPIICTEAGYATGAPSARLVSPAIQARYIARMLMLHLKAGIPRTYVYQLADHGSDEGGTMGLLTADGTEKPAWRQLSALMNELHDGPATGEAKSLEMTVEGNLADLETLTFAKTDGSYRLVLWLETPGFDPRTLRHIEVAGRQLSLSLPTGFRARRVMTFDDAGAPQTRTLAAGDASPLEVRDNLSIVEIAR